MNDETDLLQIVKKIRKFESILEASLLGEKNRKLMVEHSKQNVIDLLDDLGKDHLEIKFENSPIDQALYQQVLFKDTFQAQIPPTLF